MVKFFHEAPNKIFNQMQDITDGDYCLVHLLDSNEEYRRNFIQAREDGREIILDNSIFELGEAYDQEKYINWIRKLAPTWYIIPDVLENAEQTISNASKWIFSNENILPGKSIGVLQGKSTEEIKWCFDVLVDLVDMIAISFDYSFFENEYGGNQEEKWMKGRQRLVHEVDKWIKQNPLEHKRYHQKVHLLGAALPQEGLFYRNFYPWIYSIDTSNPVVAGIKGIQYNVSGLDSKNRHKLAVQIDDDITPAQWEKISVNVEAFKRIC